MNSAQIEACLYAGGRLIKTMSDDAASGAFWTFEDGRTARAETCEKMLADGIIRPLDDGLFPDSSQTFRLAPYPGELDELVALRHGANWTVAKRRTKKLLQQYATVVHPGDYEATCREWAARHALAAA